MTSAIGAVLSLILIPIGYFKAGITGAAAGLVLAEASIWFSSWFCARNYLGLKNTVRHLRLPILALLLAWFLSGDSAWAQSARLQSMSGSTASVGLVHTARSRLRQWFQPNED